MFEFKTVKDFQKYILSNTCWNAYKNIKKTAPNLPEATDKFIRVAKESINYPLPLDSAALKLINSSSSKIFLQISKLKLPIRIKNFLWELYQSKLPIRINSTCPLCKEGVTGNHIIRCTWIQKTLLIILQEFSREKLYGNLENTNRFFKELNLTRDKDHRNELIAIVLWSCWKTYNNNIRLNNTNSSSDFNTFYNNEVKFFNFKVSMTKRNNQYTFYKSCINFIPYISDFTQKWEDKCYNLNILF